MSFPCYHPNKYTAFSAERQHKILLKLIRRIDANLSDPDMTQAAVTEYLKLCELTNDLAPLHRLISAKLAPASSAHVILQALKPYYELPESMVKDSQLEIMQRDLAEPLHEHPAGDLVFVLDNLRSVFNVGSIFRTAECLAVRQIMLCGITPTPQHPNLAKTAMGTESSTAWEHFDETTDAIRSLKERGYTIYALETVAQAETVFETAVRYPAAIVVGNEALGISREILAGCDHIIRLPVLGRKNSLNVAVALAITAYSLRFG